jgi:2-C-methyl-D-erythritol 4-phosphate cytidylyltransferase
MTKTNVPTSAAAAAVPTAAPAPSYSADRIWAVVPCGGSGARAGGAVPKQYRTLAGLPVLAHTLNALAQVSAIAGLVLAIAPEDRWFDEAHNGVPEGGFAQLPAVQQRGTPANPWLNVHRCAGASRAQTVLNSLRVWQTEHQAKSSDWVMVHDAARCLLTPAQAQTLITACLNDPVGGLLAIALPDTLKLEVNGRVSGTVPREDKWLAQTPQMFRLGDLRLALEDAERTGFGLITDESSAMEIQGYQPKLVLGSPENIKLTYPPDFALAEAILKERQA